MPHVEITQKTDDRLELLASWEGISKGEVIARLLERLHEAGEKTNTNATTVTVFTVYQKTRVEAEFDPATHTLAITSSPWSGETFSKPSTAAIAVVEHLNPNASPNRNGWSFWRVASTGRPLDTLR
ncbi:hypothetical protein J4H86_05110 [Spiractinospora alimapuensis]|uniref:hypothetical protein n=1 Tax=Spiractinospora alimapuensis TaxID=2820884 RepID=UPI001F2D8E54|nr:hypothetical protein [Spiractinospora alimapuensis]QVQ53167.1 hypothetical protein J4H86_05110 [Spiractinospora alimapuensis]